MARVVRVAIHGSVRGLTVLFGRNVSACGRNGVWVLLLSGCCGVEIPMERVRRFSSCCPLLGITRACSSTCLLGMPRTSDTVIHPTQSINKGMIQRRADTFPDSIYTFAFCTGQTMRINTRLGVTAVLIVVQVDTSYRSSLCHPPPSFHSVQIRLQVMLTLAHTLPTKLNLTSAQDLSGLPLHQKPTFSVLEASPHNDTCFTYYNDTCITDGRGQHHGNNERCVIRANTNLYLFSPGKWSFITQGNRDVFTVNNRQFSGRSSEGPHGEFVAAGDIITWSTDGSKTNHGFEICSRTTAAPSPVGYFETTLSMPRPWSCTTTSSNGCITDRHVEHERCSFRVLRKTFLRATLWSSEADADVLQIGSSSFSGANRPDSVIVEPHDVIQWTSNGSIVGPGEARGFVICNGGDGCLATIEGFVFPQAKADVNTRTNSTLVVV